ISWQVAAGIIGLWPDRFQPGHLQERFFSGWLRRDDGCFFRDFPHSCEQIFNFRRSTFLWCLSAALALKTTECVGVAKQGSIEDFKMSKSNRLQLLKEVR